MSQASTIAAFSQPDSLSQAPAPACADPPDARFHDLQQSLGAPLQNITTLVLASLFAQSGGGPTDAGPRAGFGTFSGYSPRAF